MTLSRTLFCTMLALITAAALGAADVKHAGVVWSELKAKREVLAGAHQEFDVSRTTKTSIKSQSSKRSLIIDLSGSLWREEAISGSGNIIRIYDGANVFTLEEGGEEYLRDPKKPTREKPTPLPYSADAEWSKAIEVQRLPCVLPGMDHTCVILEAPLQTSIKQVSGSHDMSHGSERALLDVETGLVISARTVEVVDDPKGAYQTEVLYKLRRMNLAQLDAGLFRLSSADLHEVKELSRWDASKIRKQLAGKPAPELTLTDLGGKRMALGDFKGKTVLLDFWATWCPPCLADAPALDKLYDKYGGRDLAILGISVSEDRNIVEKFLSEHSHKFPIALTTENEMPRPYQIGVFPTYIVIQPDGTIFAAAEGDQGFPELRKLLKKAGLEID